MRKSLFYNPIVIIDRLAIAINRYKRKRRLKGTSAANLSLGHIDSLELLELIKNDGFTPEHIFDVGANVGTWTLLAKAIFSNAEIHAFEPLDVHVEKFSKNMIRLNKVNLHTFCLGSENTDAILNVSSFTDSSSLLAATPLEYEQFNIQKAAEAKVIVKRIDSLISAGTLPLPDLIKLDVQGYELEVLKGLGNYLNKINYLIIEVSFKEYYYGQPLFLDIANYLAKYNIGVYAFGHNTPSGTQLGQIDVLFKKLV